MLFIFKTLVLAALACPSAAMSCQGKDCKVDDEVSLLQTHVQTAVDPEKLKAEWNQFKADMDESLMTEADEEVQSSETGDCSDYDAKYPKCSCISSHDKGTCGNSEHCKKKANSKQESAGWTSSNVCESAGCDKNVHSKGGATSCCLCFWK